MSADLADLSQAFARHVYQCDQCANFQVDLEEMASLKDADFGDRFTAVEIFFASNRPPKICAAGKDLLLELFNL